MTEGQPLSTGEGGALLFRDPKLGKRARSFAQFGNLDGKTLGVNHKLSAAQAALGLARIARVLPKTFPVQAAPKAVTASAEPASRPVPDRFDPTSPADAEMIARALSRPLSGASTTVRQYEAALAHWFDAPQAISVSSGYAAVLTALLGLGLAPGDEVLLTPTCPLCTVYALLAIGVRPVFCDTRPDDFSLDLLSASKALGPRTRAIIDIPMWGYPVQADESAAFARAHGLRYVLDLALAYGVELNGKGIWSNADLAVFSTHSSKVLVTGEGGFVLTASEELAEQVRHARGGAGRAGANFRLSGLQAALGLARLPMLQKHISDRRANMDAITTGLAHPDIEPLPVCQGGTAGGVKMLVRHRRGDGAALNSHLQASGVPSDILTYRCRPLYHFPVLSSAQADCPNATALLSSIATLPVHPDIEPGHIQRMLHALNTLSCRTVA
jgi:dTDP-4-amino-4,6-dideoxygalactose transaminase